jgi:hypothetical protein
MSRLIKLMGWDQSLKVELQLKDNFRDALVRAVESDNYFGPHVDHHPDPSAPQSCSSSSDSDPTPSPSCNDPFVSSVKHRESSIENLASTSTDKAPLSARQEHFALSRVKGLGVMASYHAAGYTGDSPNLGWRLNSMPNVQARIAELNGGVEDAVGYRRDDAIRDLILIIRGKPTDVSADHPYCERHMTSWGSFHRFPSKMAALTLLARLLDWNGPTKVQVHHDPDRGFKQLHDFISKRS